MISLLAILASAPLCSSDIHTWYRVGARVEEPLRGGALTRNLNYISAGLQGPMTGPFQSWDADAGLQLQGDTKKHSSRLKILSGSVAKRFESLQLRLGWQKIAWGETFGFYIADIVCPRDYSDPWLNDMNWMRKSVPAIQAKWLEDQWSLEAVITPWPRRATLPPSSTLADPNVTLINKPFLVKYPHFANGKAMEGGLRIGYLSSWGTDLHMFAYRHWNRNLIFELQPSQASYMALPVQKRTTSIGLSASHNLSSTILRSDIVYHLNMPWASPNYGSVNRQNVLESVFGADYSLDHGENIAFQLHYDRWMQDDRYGMSFRLAGKEQSQGIYPELFGYMGLGSNRDRWLQPRLVWNISKIWQAKLQVNLLSGKSDPYKPQTGIITKKSGPGSTLLWITANF